jgi:hypothetical protein
MAHNFLEPTSQHVLPAFVNPYAVVTVKSHVLINLEMEKNSNYNKGFLFKYTPIALLMRPGDS